MNQEIKAFLKEMLSIIITAFILAMILRTFVVEGRIIPSASMLPTLQIQDRVLVNKFIYRFKDPQRGDIIVFEPPKSVGSDQDYIKRVVGLPGDKVEVKDNLVFINDVSLDEPYLNETIIYEFGPVIVPEDSLLVLGDNRNHSFDSHLWNAWLTEDHIKGKAFMIYWPVKHIHLLEREVSFSDENIIN